MASLKHNMSAMKKDNILSSCVPLTTLFLLVSLFCMCGVVSANSFDSNDYKEALSKAILFFEGQRSGKLPANQRMTWRKDSALSDGHQQNVDLVGGYYDAGDGMKFSFPMAFATTMLAWSVIENRQELEGAGELQNALEAIKWSTDYLLKSVSAKENVIYAQVGDPNIDHSCWERPEDMDTPRSVYWIDTSRPGSDLAGEIAAAFAASSLAFRPSDSAYASRLLSTAHSVFDFANNHRGSYSNAFTEACPYYCSYSGYEDELIWSAAWLYRASKQPSYMSFVVSNHNQLTQHSPPFSWDDKHAGIHVLLAQILLGETDVGISVDTEEIKDLADNFVCSVLPEVTSSDARFAQQASLGITPGGLLFVSADENLQYATSAAFLLMTYARTLRRASRMVTCGTYHGAASAFHPHHLWLFAKQQVDYILGENPMRMSYMVGFGNRYPQRLHHRGSSMPCVTAHPQHIACKAGFAYFNSPQSNPNLLIGAVSGGPDASDRYADDRTDYKQSEPALYINAPLVGALASLTTDMY